MLTTGPEYWPESQDAAASFSNSNRSNHSAYYNGHDHELEALDISSPGISTPSTVDYDTPSPLDMQDEGESVDNEQSNPPALPFSYYAMDGRQHGQVTRQEPYMQREAPGVQFQQQQQQQQQGQAGQPPNLVVLSCEVCSSPTVQLCEGCEKVGYCSREHQTKDWLRHSKDCRNPARTPAAPSPIQTDADNNTDGALDRYTPGKVFEVDAILIPADQSIPQLVKAAFAVDVDEEQVTIQHFERCFDELLGKAAPWIEDGQWDEDTSSGRGLGIQQPQRQISLLSSISAGATAPRFSLHCRPNGQPNRCYEALLGVSSDQNANSGNSNINNFGLPFSSPFQYQWAPPSLSQLGTPPAKAFDTADPSLQELKHLRGNGSYLILKHPSKTSAPQLDGTPVLDATLADLKLVVPYLRQRLQQKNMGGLRARPGVYQGSYNPQGYPTMAGMPGMGSNVNLNNMSSRVRSEGPPFFRG